MTERKAFVDHLIESKAWTSHLPDGQHGLKSGLGDSRQPNRYVSRNNQLNKLFMLLLAASLVIGVIPSTLIGCSTKTPPISATYTVNLWTDLQPVLDNASNSDVIDLSNLWSPEVQMSFTIPANLEATIVGHRNVTFTGVSFSGGGSNSITICDLNISSVNNQDSSTLHFSGKGNQLIIEGDNIISYFRSTEKSGNGAAVGVPEGVELTISGNGRLTASGQNGGASIGGGKDKASGSITIKLSDPAAHVTASSIAGAAGIGGGRGGNAGAIIIDGNVTVFAINDAGGIGTAGSNSDSAGTNSGAAEASLGAAGIGGGRGGNASNITINGGYIYISGIQGSGAALGGGAKGAGGKITINSGSIAVSNLNNGCAIGGGLDGTAAEITMHGGAFTAQGAVKAINGTFVELPAVYYWWGSAALGGEEALTMLYPGDPFVGSDMYKYVRIESAEVVSISVEPTYIEMSKGATQQFTVTVIATGGASQAYRWSLSGHNSQATFIDAEGNLTIAANETATTITVIATSAFNNEVSGEATVIVVSGT